MGESVADIKELISVNINITLDCFPVLLGVKYVNQEGETHSKVVRADYLWDWMLINDFPGDIAPHLWILSNYAKTQVEFDLMNEKWKKVSGKPLIGEEGDKVYCIQFYERGVDYWKGNGMRNECIPIVEIKDHKFVEEVVRIHLEFGFIGVDPEEGLGKNPMLMCKLEVIPDERGWKSFYAITLRKLCILYFEGKWNKGCFGTSEKPNRLLWHFSRFIPENQFNKIEKEYKRVTGKEEGLCGFKFCEKCGGELEGGIEGTVQRVYGVPPMSSIIDV